MLNLLLHKSAPAVTFAAFITGTRWDLLGLERAGWRLRGPLSSKGKAFLLPMPSSSYSVVSQEVRTYGFVDLPSSPPGSELSMPPPAPTSIEPC
jgi:hypothetical protein